MTRLYTITWSLGNARLTISTFDKEKGIELLKQRQQELVNMRARYYYYDHMRIRWEDGELNVDENELDKVY